MVGSGSVEGRLKWPESPSHELDDPIGLREFLIGIKSAQHQIKKSCTQLCLPFNSCNCASYLAIHSLCLAMAASSLRIFPIP